MAVSSNHWILVLPRMCAIMSPSDSQGSAVISRSASVSRSSRSVMIQVPAFESKRSVAGARTTYEPSRRSGNRAASTGAGEFSAAFRGVSAPPASGACPGAPVAAGACPGAPGAAGVAGEVLGLRVCAVALDPCAGAEALGAGDGDDGFFTGAGDDGRSGAPAGAEEAAEPSDCAIAPRAINRPMHGARTIRARRRHTKRGPCFRWPLR